MRHRFHSICPYFAMFPEEFVGEQLDYCEPGGWVFDPFSGRGTTVFESLRHFRNAAGCDVNPVAVCLSRAKASPPCEEAVLQRLVELNAMEGLESGADCDEFFAACFHPATLSQILLLRNELAWETDDVDCFIAAMALGCLHGESHRSKRYFSNRMPRTISTKPAYSIRWWRERGLCPPNRDVMAILSEETRFRFRTPPPHYRGTVKCCDARSASLNFTHLHGSVSLIVTSPPYLDVTDFEEDQWLRLWFLGGPPSPVRDPTKDHRHRDPERYWQFLTESWAGCEALLADSATVVVRIGGRLTAQEAQLGVQRTLSDGLRGRKLTLISSSTTEIVKSQRRVHAPKAEGTGKEFDFVYEARS